MADRVHPNASPPSNTAPSSSTPPSGTYVIQLPKDQTYRIPPPENAQRYANYTRRKSRRCRCCCCLCWLIGILFTLIVLMAIAAGVFYLIVRPEAPKYAIDHVSVKGMNLTSLSTISPEFDVSVRADNGNNKIGIYYESDSSVEMFYRGVSLCNGVLPAFYQPSNNVTVFQTVLKGNGIELARSDQRALVNAVTKRSVPLTLKLRAPVKIKVGSVKTWKIRVKVDCDLTVDQLTAQAKIVRKDCSYGFDLWL